MRVVPDSQPRDAQVPFSKRDTARPSTPWTQGCAMPTDFRASEAERATEHALANSHGAIRGAIDWCVVRALLAELRRVREERDANIAHVLWFHDRIARWMRSAWAGCRRLQRNRRDRDRWRHACLEACRRKALVCGHPRLVRRIACMMGVLSMKKRQSAKP